VYGSAIRRRRRSVRSLERQFCASLSVCTCSREVVCVCLTIDVMFHDAGMHCNQQRVTPSSPENRSEERGIVKSV